jgi:hypothetical protein
MKDIAVFLVLGALAAVFVLRLRRRPIDGNSAQDSVIAATLLGALGASRTTNARVEVRETTTSGWRVAMTVEPHMDLVPQPLPDRDFLCYDTRQDGAAIYIGSRARPEERDWAEAYMRWEIACSEHEIWELAGIETGTAPTPPQKRVLVGTLMRASRAERYDFPRTNAIVCETLEFCAKQTGREPDADPWILMVGINEKEV